MVTLRSARKRLEGKTNGNRTALWHERRKTKRTLKIQQKQGEREKNVVLWGGTTKEESGQANGGRGKPINGNKMNALAELPVFRGHATEKT